MSGVVKALSGRGVCRRAMRQGAYPEGMSQEVAVMNRWNRRGGWMCSLWRGGLRVMLSVAVVCFGLPREAGAICGLDAGFTGQVRVLEDPGAREAWARWLARRGGAACSACHVAGYGPRNPYGSAMGVLLSGSDRDDESWKREAGRRVGEIPAIPPMDGSPTRPKGFRCLDSAPRPRRSPQFSGKHPPSKRLSLPRVAKPASLPRATERAPAAWEPCARLG
ncbi:MAG: hypothetical protein RLZZ179_1429 [Verrucomicrobiota bacterium]|jgi:hypothetical protein